ncbi:MAG UNVERIFIED_CONTAM: hypothetical protein LVR18_50240 [Planctomycetaceae bacterium]
MGCLPHAKFNAAGSPLRIPRQHTTTSLVDHRRQSLVTSTAGTTRRSSHSCGRFFSPAEFILVSAGSPTSILAQVPVLCNTLPTQATTFGLPSL